MLSGKTDIDALLASSYAWDPFNLPPTEAIETRMRRLYDIRASYVDARVGSDREIADILAVNNVVESWFLGLRETHRAPDLARLGSIRSAFYNNSRDDLSFARWLDAASPCTEVMDLARRALSSQLRAKITAERRSPRRGRGRVDELIGELREQQLKLLSQVVENNIVGDPPSVYRQLLVTVDANTTRRKLVEAWGRIARNHVEDLREALWDDYDDYLELNCRDKSDELEGIGAVLNRFREAALRDANTLCAGGTASADFYSDVPYQQQQPLLGVTSRVLSAEEAFAIAHHVLDEMAGVTLTVNCRESNVWFVTLSVGATELTRTRVAFESETRMRFRNNYTQPVRNRVVLPAGIVSARSAISCRVLQDEESPLTLSFQNLLSLLHELGHALQHAWPREAPVNLAGLEAVPAVMSESVSLFLEKGAFVNNLPVLLGRAELASPLSIARNANMMVQRMTAPARAEAACLAVALARGNRYGYDLLWHRTQEGPAGAWGEFVENLVDVAQDRLSDCPWRYVIGGIEAAAAVRGGCSAPDLLREPRAPMTEVADYFDFYRAPSSTLSGLS